MTEKKEPDFLEMLRKNLISDGSNYYTDNFDYYVFGSKKPLKKRIVNQLKKVFFSKPILALLFSIRPVYKSFFLGSLFKYKKYIKPLGFMYQHLASKESKSLFMKLVEFRLLGYLKVRLPLSRPDYWNGIKEFESKATPTDFIEITSFPWKLYLHDMTGKGIPIKVYLGSKAAFTTFEIQQYIKVDGNENMGPKAGNVVLDMGGCFGDTAIFFSSIVGKVGKVYSFEFIPGNVNVFKKNLSINPEIKDGVEIIQNPLWEVSKKKIYYKEAGAASRVSFEKFEGMDGESETISVDDFVQARDLKKVDFIKSDIEGAEPYMLKGAINTLKKFTPTLAISIYHNMDDFSGIIKWIDDLKLGYKFYLGHYTIYASETILYAVKE